VIAKKIDDYLAANQPANQPGISIVIIKNGEQVYSGGKGMADIPSGVAIASNTGFRLASVSKPFTAIAVMQLVERGELKLTDSLLDYIPELPEAWRSITIDHLLAHRSGIYDIFNDYLSPTLVNGMDHTKLINYFITNPKLEFETGTRTDYSNTGYMLLATVIERKTGLSFPMYMQQNIFGPANMSGSYINDISQAIKYGDALNYGRLRTYYGITTNLKGSMAQVSSRDDFVHFFDALRNNTLVSAQTLADMWRSRGNLAGTPVGFGYGFAIIDDTVGHGGDWDGFQTEMTFIPSKGVAFAILTNGGSVGRSRLHDIRNIIVTTEF
jgi:CubicO group peptidase (beta-lactamase class C family)